MKRVKKNQTIAGKILLGTALIFIFECKLALPSDWVVDNFHRLHEFRHTTFKQYT
jgi:hypothetical protein